MPRCGSQIYLCDLPVRFDTYQGCAHKCKYCFASRKKDIANIEPDESPAQLLNFINGKRNLETRWCDWNIPLHIGGMSDPLQPCEKVQRRTYKCLEILRETQYPFVMSTKGKLLGDDEYLDILAECNGVIQVSLVSPQFDKLEPGCPPFEERLRIVEKAAKRVKRVIIRCQPYVTEVFDDVYSQLETYSNIGVYGIIIEGMKLAKKSKGLVKVGADWTYPKDIITRDFMRLKDRAHEVGLKIYAGENRIRALGDSLTCCGIDGLEGFRGNSYNLNHILNGGDYVVTDAMKQPGSAGCYKAIYQDTVGSRKLKGKSLQEFMLLDYMEHKDKIDAIMGKD